MSINEIKKSFQDQMHKDLSKNPQLPWWLSLPGIVIITAIFWPVGIFLIRKRMDLDKKTALFSGAAITVVGWVFLAIAIIGLLANSAGCFERTDTKDTVLILFFIIAGIALILLGRSTRKNAIKFKKYISIVINQQITSIDNIAAVMSTNYDVCKKQLQKMIDKGYFNGAYIDEVAREIVLSKQYENVSSKSSMNNTPQSQEIQVVACRGCGANNKIAKGSVGECEFCGSPLS